MNCDGVGKTQQEWFTRTLYAVKSESRQIGLPALSVDAPGSPGKQFAKSLPAKDAQEGYVKPPGLA
jgi:hypothetical protein